MQEKQEEKKEEKEEEENEQEEKGKEMKTNLIGGLWLLMRKKFMNLLRIWKLFMCVQIKSMETFFSARLFRT